MCEISQWLKKQNTNKQEVHGPSQSPECKLHLSNLLVIASYHDYQEYIWFMGGDHDHFQDNL